MPAPRSGEELGQRVPSGTQAVPPSPPPMSSSSASSEQLPSRAAPSVTIDKTSAMRSVIQKPPSEAQLCPWLVVQHSRTALAAASSGGGAAQLAHLVLARE